MLTYHSKRRRTMEKTEESSHMLKSYLSKYMIHRSMSIQEHFQIFMSEMGFMESPSYPFSFDFTFFDLDKLQSRDNPELIRDYFAHQNMLLDTMREKPFPSQKKKILKGSSFAKIYADDEKIYKVFNISKYFLEVIQEAFVGYMLYLYFPQHVPKVGDFTKFERRVGCMAKKYIYFTQTHYSNGTYFHNFEKYSDEEHYSILYQICLTLQSFQKSISFIHADLKTNNICVSEDKSTIHFIDFGYSSFIHQHQIIGADLSLSFESFMLNETFAPFCKGKTLDYRMIHNENHAFSSDLFYLAYSILLHHFYEEDFKNARPQFYAFVHGLFDVVDSDGKTINLFDTFMKINTTSFDFVGFFMSKSSSMFFFYFGNRIDVDAFYERFRPENLIHTLQQKMYIYGGA